MEYLKIFLLVYGLFILAGIFLKFPFIYNNMKSKFIINKIGNKGFNIFLFVLAIIVIVIGIII